MKTPRWFLLATAAALVLSVYAHAEDFGTRSRAVHGRVLDRDGEPVRGAAVQIENMLTLQVRSFVTPKGGTYHFDELFSNVDYRLRAEYHGAFSPSKALSRFDAGKDATMDLTLDAVKGETP